MAVIQALLKAKWCFFHCGAGRWDLGNLGAYSTEIKLFMTLHPPMGPLAIFFFQ